VPVSCHWSLVTGHCSCDRVIADFRVQPCPFPYQICYLESEMTSVLLPPAGARGEIDLTDIPETADWSKAVVGKFYRHRPSSGRFTSPLIGSRGLHNASGPVKVRRREPRAGSQELDAVWLTLRFVTAGTNRGSQFLGSRKLAEISIERTEGEMSGLTCQFQQEAVRKAHARPLAKSL